MRTTRRQLSFVGLVAILLAACGADKAVPTEDKGPPPSAIGNEVVQWMAVSPAYARTGLVLAVSTRPRECVRILQDCYNRLWVTNDGGATWKRPGAAGFNDIQPVIAADSSGHETLFSRGESELQRSDDGGETWVRAGPRGFPTPLPTYVSDSMVAVAGGASNYLLNAATGVTHTVAGSGGTLDDIAFAFAPGFPETGPYPPAWLVGLSKENGRAIVQQCNAQLVCMGSSILPGTPKYLLVPSFHPSAEYARDGVVFVKADQFMYKSTDGGVTFKALKILDNAPSTSKVRMIAVPPNYAEAGSVRTVYAAVAATFDETMPEGGRTSYTGGGIYRTSDGGESWRRFDSGSFDKGGNALAVAPDGRFFAAFLHGKIAWDGGLLCSTDGKKWNASCPPVGSAETSAGSQLGSQEAMSGAEAEAVTRSASGGLAFWLVATLALVVVVGAVGAFSLLRKRSKKSQISRQETA